MRTLLLIVLVAASAQGAAAQFQPQIVARNLETPWSMAFAPDGRIFVAERPGRIRIILRDTLRGEPWAVINAHESASRSIESGLMGLALDPAFARNGRVYICYTEQIEGDRIVNRVGVLTERAGRGTDLRVLVDGIPAERYHNGCRLSFGPDGKLYATTGDGADSRERGGAAQQLDSRAGKVLRLNTDGSVPADNPFPGSYVWSYGHRNSQGLAWQPRTNRLFATEHGTGADGGNEINIIERGKNYGWPTVIGFANDARFTNPIFVGPHAPAGATFVTGSRYPALAGKLLVTTLAARRLLAVAVDVNPAQATIVIDTTYGRLRDVVQGPDGYLYIATSNRDGRGRPTGDDDRIIRLVPLRSPR